MNLKSISDRRIEFFLIGSENIILIFSGHLFTGKILLEIVKH